MQLITAQRFKRGYYNMYTIFKDENNKVLEINRSSVQQLKYGCKNGIVKGKPCKLVWETIQ